MHADDRGVQRRRRLPATGTGELELGIADNAAVGYLDENPEFHHQLLLVRSDALWLVPDERGAWALPGFVSDEQHTAEVELIARHMRERFGVPVVILGRAVTEFDAVANRVRKVDLAETIVDPEPRFGRRWPRAVLTAALAWIGAAAGPVDDVEQVRVKRWSQQSALARIAGSRRVRRAWRAR
jgi:ADP-ribose pyrophosphatase YjhB (NUDIX family)